MVLRLQELAVPVQLLAQLVVVSLELGDPQLLLLDPLLGQPQLLLPRPTPSGEDALDEHHARNAAADGDQRQELEQVHARGTAYSPLGQSSSATRSCAQRLVNTRTRASRMSQTSRFTSVL